jgi:hypothetical protein
MSTIAVNAITDANGGATTTINSVTPNTFNVVGKNKIINGNFDFWQRGTTASYSNQSTQYLADRWLMRTTATANVTISQQSFTVGQTDVPNNPKYFYRWDITSHTTGSGILEQRIEDVSTFAGNTFTLSFWAKCSTAQTLSSVYRQDFGTGGSTAVTTSGSSFSLTTAWQKFTVTVTLPSISGKTIAGGNDYLGIRFNVPAAVCAFDIAQVQLEAGSSATEFEHRPYTTELQLCQRYFEKFAPGIADGVPVYVGSYAASPGGSAGTWYFKQEMRAIPTISLGAGSSAANTISRAHLGVFASFNTYGRIYTPVTASAEL